MKERTVKKITYDTTAFDDESVQQMEKITNAVEQAAASSLFVKLVKDVRQKPKRIAGWDADSESE